MKNIRQATTDDLPRIAEIVIFNYRLNFYPIFQDDDFYFKEMQVVNLIKSYKDIVNTVWVYDDGAVKGFVQVENGEVKKLFVEPILQGKSIGTFLLDYAINEHNANYLWALEKNTRAIRFYGRHGFRMTEDKKLEEDTTEYLVRLERYKMFNSYKEYMTAEMLMGPNSARILEELLTKYPLQLNDENTVLDLGCGKGLTSLILAKETGAKIYANDLWISAEDNKKRFDDWEVNEQITSVCEDANDLNFAKNQFDALVSIDAYHYFATGNGFFENKILPFLNDNVVVLIGVPGIKDEYTGRSEELLSEWLGDEAYMFQSPSAWREIIGNNERIEVLDTWEMDCFELAWDEWFTTGHKYALGDKQFYETLIKLYTCFVGIYIKIRE